MPEITPSLADELVHRGYESSDLDYKRDFDNSTGAWMELAKDVFAMSNAGGGHIVLGVEDATFSPVGLDESFHIDSQVWTDKISKWATGRIDIAYFEHVAQTKVAKKKFPVLRIVGSVGSLVIPKSDGSYTSSTGEAKVAFKRGVIYTRRDTSSVACTGDEFWRLFWALLKRTAEKTGSQGTPLEVLSALSKKAQPDTVEETLWFNLFPVTDLPDYVYVARTEHRDPRAMFDEIRAESQAAGNGEPTDIPSFILLEKRIYSFVPFDGSNPLNICVSAVEKPILIGNWLEDSSMHHRLIMLLNFNLKDLCRKKGFYWDQRRERFFMRYFGGPAPEITWKPYKKITSRQLVFPRVGADGTLSYCEHFAGRLRFVVLGGGVYLLIEPIRVLTVDGQNPLDQKRNVRISTKKSFYYHNNNYLYDTKLWLHILAGNRTEIHLGVDPGRVIVSVLPISGRTNVGILDDQHTSEDFLDTLKSEPLEYNIFTYDESQESNPLTDTSMEE
jgi:hypothetical protein